MTHFQRVVVTGGAGFIGSHLVDFIVDRGLANEIVVIDNLSSGSLSNIAQHIDKPYLKFVHSDLKVYDSKWVEHFKDAEIVFHLAANPDVRTSVEDPRTHFEENIVATFNVLEACRVHDVKLIVFASSSTVYGDAKRIPTPENYYPLEPISIYGASKLSAEILVTTYSRLYGIKSLILRYANIIGPRCNHGVIVDFIRKLKANPQTLEILGDGTQRKSYLHVYDAVSATLFLVNYILKHNLLYEIFNVGNVDWITVLEIADIVVKEMGLRNVKYIFKPATPDGRGWLGDVKFMLLDVSKLQSLGWRPSMNSKEAVRKTVRALLGKE